MNIDPMFSNPLSEYIKPLTIIGIILIVYCIFNYIATAISLYSIGKRRGTEAYGLAWVPGLQGWTIGAIADKFDLRRGEKDHKWRLVLLILSLLTIAGFVIGGSSVTHFVKKIIEINNSGALDSGTASATKLLGLFASMIGSMFLSNLLMTLCAAGRNVCAWVCQYKLFNSCKPQRPVLLLLLFVMIPFAAPFVMLACKNYDNGVNCKTVQPELIEERVEW